VPIYALGDLEPDIHPDAYVHPDAVLIGQLTLGAGSSVWAHTVIRADDAPIYIGARTSIQDGSVVHTTLPHPTRVGDDCVIGHMVHLEGCIIEDGALVGSGSIVLHEAVVGTGSIVGANAVVTNGMKVPPHSMALGVPAKVRPAPEHQDALILFNAANYVERGQRYRKDLRRID
jgi:carbonic anhydrase/acetyltransferase-like protein (isoleucine patch superfamily)